MKIVEIAEAEIGYLEKKSNHMLEDKTANAGFNNFTKYGAWYPMQGLPWCAVFVSWCADRAGVLGDTIPKHASCTAGVNWFKARSKFRPRAGYTPKPGDICYFTHDGKVPVHVGIVAGAGAGTVTTIEGNTSAGSVLEPNGGGVARKSYPVGYSKILGYGCPDYPGEEEKMTQKEFGEMMDRWITEQGEKAPSDWSQKARAWAEERNYIAGDEKGRKKYRKFATREELIQILYNILKQ